MSADAPTTLRAEREDANIRSDHYSVAAARCILAAHNFKTAGALPADQRRTPCP